MLDYLAHLTGKQSKNVEPHAHAFSVLILSSGVSFGRHLPTLKMRLIPIAVDELLEEEAAGHAKTA